MSTLIETEITAQTPNATDLKFCWNYSLKVGQLKNAITHKPRLKTKLINLTHISGFPKIFITYILLKLKQRMPLYNLSKPLKEIACKNFMVTTWLYWT